MCSTPGKSQQRVAVMQGCMPWGRVGFSTPQGALQGCANTVRRSLQAVICAICLSTELRVRAGHVWRAGGRAGGGARRDVGACGEHAPGARVPGPSALCQGPRSAACPASLRAPVLLHSCHQRCPPVVPSRHRQFRTQGTARSQTAPASVQALPTAVNARMGVARQGLDSMLHGPMQLLCFGCTLHVLTV